MKYKNIAVSGEIGTGTTTLAKTLAKKIGWKYESAGEYVRRWHKENNIDVINTEMVPEELDKKLDYGFLEKIKVGEGIVYDWRIGGVLIENQPDVLKVLLTCDEEVAMDRIAGRDHESREEAVNESKHRAAEHRKKFKKLYGAEYYLDPKYFDLVIDTTNLNQEEVLESVLEKLV